MTDRFNYERNSDWQLNETVRRLTRRVEETQRRIADRQRRRWERLLGSRLGEMMESIEATEHATTASDPRIREGAFALLAHYWQPGSHLSETFKQAALCDSDALVRGAAVSCLITLYRGTGNTDVCAMLARMVRDPFRPAPLRHVAYLGLLDVTGMKVSVSLVRALLMCKGGMPAETDWSMVDSFLSQRG